MTRGKLRCWAAYSGLLAGGVYYGAMCLAGGYIYGANPPAQVLLSLFCHGSLLVLGLTVTGTERFGPRDAALPVYYAALAAFVLISPRLYLAANRASLRRGEEHLRAAPV